LTGDPGLAPFSNQPFNVHPFHARHIRITSLALRNRVLDVEYAPLCLQTSFHVRYLDAQALILFPVLIHFPMFHPQTKPKDTLGLHAKACHIFNRVQEILSRKFGNRVSGGIDDSILEQALLVNTELGCLVAQLEGHWNTEAWHDGFATASWLVSFSYAAGKIYVLIIIDDSLRCSALVLLHSSFCRQAESYEGWHSTIPQHLDTLEEMANNQLVAMARSSDFDMLSPFMAIILFHLVQGSRSLGGIYESKHQNTFRHLLRCLARQWRLARE
jgi:hypothetical protein